MSLKESPRSPFWGWVPCGGLAARSLGGDHFAVPVLQEDYHKLLTKYAEAENTIDQLRLGAKVWLRGGGVGPGHWG